MIRRDFIGRIGGAMAALMTGALPKPRRQEWYAYATIGTSNLDPVDCKLKYCSEPRWDCVTRAMKIMEDGFQKR